MGNEVFDITEALLRTDGDMELFQELRGYFLKIILNNLLM